MPWDKKSTPCPWKFPNCILQHQRLAGTDQSNLGMDQSDLIKASRSGEKKIPLGRWFITLCKEKSVQYADYATLSRIRVEALFFSTNGRFGIVVLGIRWGGWFGRANPVLIRIRPDNLANGRLLKLADSQNQLSCMINKNPLNWPILVRLPILSHYQTLHFMVYLSKLL